MTVEHKGCRVTLRTLLEISKKSMHIVSTTKVVVPVFHIPPSFQYYIYIFIYIVENVLVLNMYEIFGTGR